MANPQAENGYLRVANDIWNELIRRDFTKRQKDIIFFVWRLSYGCRQKTAVIPQLKHFELCGVGKTNITKELNYLVGSRVLLWDKHLNAFEVNKDYEKWQVSPVAGWNDDIFNKLISDNLDRSRAIIDKVSYQNDNRQREKPPPKITVSYQNDNMSVIKTITGRLLKRELQGLKKPYVARVRRLPKDNSKDIIKNNTVITIPADDSEEWYPPIQPIGEKEAAYQKLESAYCTLHCIGQWQLKSNDSIAMQALIDLAIPVEFIINVMRDMHEGKRKREAKRFKHPSTFNYYSNTIVTVWETKNTPRNGGQTNVKTHSSTSRYARTNPASGYGTAISAADVDDFIIA